MQYYFVENIKDNKAILEKNDYHHIKNVMRMKDGDNLVVVFSTKKFLAKVNYINQKDFEVLVIEEMDEDNELKNKITLIYALPRFDKFELVLQKAVELGVSEVVPLLLKRSTYKLNNIEHKYERWQKIIKEAAEQSKRNKLPILKDVISNIKEIKDYTSDLNYFAYEVLSKDYVKDFTSEISGKESISLIVGNEGGFLEVEAKEIEKNGFKPISLGKRILRSETAAIYLLSLVAFRSESR